MPRRSTRWLVDAGVVQRIAYTNHTITFIHTVQHRTQHGLMYSDTFRVENLHLFNDNLQAASGFQRLFCLWIFVDENILDAVPSMVNSLNRTVLLPYTHKHTLVTLVTGFLRSTDTTDS